MKTINRARVCIVGTGRVAHHYMKLRELGLFQDIEFTTCFDENEIKAIKFGKDYQLDSLKSLTEINANEIDLVVVSTPSGTHFEVAKACLHRGVPVLIEKPVALRVEDAHSLEQLALDLGIELRSVFQNRYNSAMKEAFSIVHSGQLGKILTFSLTTLWCRYQEYYDDGWHGKWESDGGVCSQQAIHHLDALNYLLGMPDTVCAFAGKRINNLEAEDTLVGIFNIKGIIGTGQFTTAIRPQDLEASITIIGEKLSLRVTGVALNRLELIDSKGSYITKIDQHVDNGYGFGHAELFDDFIAEINGSESSVMPKIQESINALMVVDALYESAENGKVTEVQRECSHSKLGLK